MKITKNNSLHLQNGSRIAIVGGGPAGSFFANFALHLAREKGIEISVTIFDRRCFSQSGQHGCNMCAGVISESLCKKLNEIDIFLPDSKIQQFIKGYYFQTQDCGLQLYHPQKHHKPNIVTVFRGGGPRNITDNKNISFDDFLLQHAEGHGAEVINTTIEEIDLPHHFGAPVNLVVIKNRKRENIQADLVVGAFGLNTNITKRIIGRNIKYRPPSSGRACNTELYLGKAYIDKHFGGNIYCLSLGIDPIKFAAFTPKSDYITVSLIGKKDVTKEHLVKFLKHPVVKDLLPDNWTIPKDICICFPKIPIGYAKHPYADRMVIIGDASISRFYKSGIESAFITAQIAAETAFNCGVTEDAFKRDYYKKAKKLLARDNLYGRFIYNINDFVSSRRHLMTPHLEYAKKNINSWAAGQINETLWGMVTGNLQYKKIFFKFLSLRFQITLLPLTIKGIYKIFQETTKAALQYKIYKVYGLSEKRGMGALKDGDTVAIIGGGPAGSSCAISLLSQAKKKRISLNVVIYEWKTFDDNVHNECACVLSSVTIKRMIEKYLDIPFPDHLIKSYIKGYCLHSNGEIIKFEESEDHKLCGMLRWEFDKYMLDQACKAGAEVIASRVTDIEIGKQKVTVYSETKHIRADVLVAAFGIEEGTGAILERESGYKTPRYILTMLTRYQPTEGQTQLKEDNDYIHAFLPSNKDIEFGAIIPKGDSYTINIAGSKIHTHSMQRFVALKTVQKVLPSDFRDKFNDLDFHRGSIPITPAKHPFGDRYVVIGNAAGLINHFKGINSACLTGIKAAEVILNIGISKEAFKVYYSHFSETVRDLLYAGIIRKLVIIAENRGCITLIIDLAKKDKRLRNAICHIISGDKPYKTIVRDVCRITLLIKIFKGLTLCFFKNKQR